MWQNDACSCCIYTQAYKPSDMTLTQQGTQAQHVLNSFTDGKHLTQQVLWKQRRIRLSLGSMWSSVLWSVSVTDQPHNTGCMFQSEFKCGLWMNLQLSNRAELARCIECAHGALGWLLREQICQKQETNSWDTLATLSKAQYLETDPLIGFHW